MKRVLKWLSLLFAVSVFSFVLIFLYNINQDEPIQKPEPFVLESKIEKQKSQALWLNHLSKTQKKIYYLPVEEVYVKVDLFTPKAKKRVYELVVQKLDPYQKFCLQEELRRFHLRYAFRQTDTETNLFVYSSELSRLNSLVKVLEKYQIKAKILQR